MYIGFQKLRLGLNKLIKLVNLYLYLGFIYFLK